MKINQSHHYGFGIETNGKKNFKYAIAETIKSAKLFGKADLEDKMFETDFGTKIEAENYFDGNFRTSYVFCKILSHYGWIASIGMISIIIALNIKLLINATKITDTYGKLIMMEVSIFYMIQTIFNLAMNLGIGFIAEFQLPFISGGYVNSLTNLLCMSLILSIYRRKAINLEEPKKSKVFVKIEDFFFEEYQHKSR